MRAEGNGNPAVCANNLLRMVRGEVPYDRVKGLDPSLIDRPVSSSAVAVKQDAEWLIETYEPRAALHGLNMEPPETAGGSFVITANITEKEE